MKKLLVCLDSALQACPRKVSLICTSEVLDAFSEPLWVDEIKIGMPDWAYQPGLQYRATLVLTFSRNFDISTLVPQQTLQVSLRGTQSGRTAMNISGTIVPKKGNDPTIAFISEKNLKNLIDPQAGENIEFSVMVVGTDKGNGAVVDFKGEALDGDEDNIPGGDFIAKFTVIG